MAAVESKNIILQITSTLEEIQKVNELMRFHQSFEEPDEHALQNFIRLRSDFLQQLDDLMKELNLEVKWRKWPSFPFFADFLVNTKLSPLARVFRSHSLGSTVPRKAENPYSIASYKLSFATKPVV
ncbi:MAG: hypothetical protein IPO07_15680 [Haliscomenobacter sp.]|nr:hypothetical protein [Haliscomenobacter sp.]MBK9490047.1 hypothetical protein [Haliscomenobacter sp.]